MDLVDYSEDVFTEICDGFPRIRARSRIFRTSISSRSARWTATTSSRDSPRTPWYRGGSAAGASGNGADRAELRRRDAFPGAVRHPADSGFPRLRRAGCVGRHSSAATGVMVLPSGRTSRVKSIVTCDGDLEEALCAAVGHGLPGRRDRYQPRRHAGAALPHAACIAPVRSDGRVDAHGPDAGRPALSAEAHDAAGPGHYHAICIIASISTIFRSIPADTSGAERDRRSLAGDPSPALLRCVPEESRNRRIHPDRSGFEPDRRLPE